MEVKQFTDGEEKGKIDHDGARKKLFVNNTEDVNDGDSDSANETSNIGDESLERSVANMDFNDTFNQLIPSSSQVKGKNIIINYENKSSNVTPPARAMRYSNRHFVVTCLNESVSFIAVNGKSFAKHDRARFGVIPCRLYPHCNEVLKGGEDIGLVYVVSPTEHEYYEKECWVCGDHAQASIDGNEVQMNVRKDTTETPINKKKQETPQAPKKSTRNKNKNM